MMRTLIIITALLGLTLEIEAKKITIININGGI